MPSYQTKIKGEPGWCEPEQHESYQDAAKLELDVLLSALDDDEDVSAQITVVVRDVATGTEVDVVFAAQEDGHYDVVETSPHHAHHVVDIARPGSEPPQSDVAALIESLPGKVVVVVLDGTEIRGRVTEAHRHGFGLAGMPGRFFAWGCNWKESTEPNIEKRLCEAMRVALASWPTEGGRDRWVRENVLPAIADAGLVVRERSVVE